MFAPPRMEVTQDARTLVTTGRLRARVAPSAARLAGPADPQMWASNSPFFRETHKALMGSAGYERDPHPPVPGTSWQGLLHEHFEWRLGPLQVCRFLNILNIDYRVSPDRLQLDYSLHRPLAGSTWLSRQPLGVDVDSGHLSAAAASGGGTELEIVKTIRFVDLESAAPPGPGNGVSSDLLNRMAPSLLRWWLRRGIAPWLAGPSLPVDNRYQPG